MLCPYSVENTAGGDHHPAAAPGVIIDTRQASLKDLLDPWTPMPLLGAPHYVQHLD